MKKVLKSIISSFGYEIKKTYAVNSQGFQLHNYDNPDGSFNYEKYKEVQISGNKRKIENVWVTEENIAFLSDYIKQNVPDLKFGLCHGTRRGKEQEWFRKYLGIEVIGTEISDTAKDFPHTIQWDFHDVKDEWVGNVDFIYSNSMDHSYDPKKCLNSWMSCIKKGGVCIIEHSAGHELSTELDPFGAPLSIMPYLILNWSEGDFYVTEILNPPVVNQQYSKYLIIRNK